MKYMVAGLIAPFALALLYAIPLWLVRRYFPRAEPYLFGPLYNVGHLIGRMSAALVRPFRRPRA